MSSRQKCKLLCERYAKKKYEKFSANEAYTIRSNYSHGEDYQITADNPAKYMKYVVLDNIKSYFQETEQVNKDNNT